MKITDPCQKQTYVATTDKTTFSADISRADIYRAGGRGVPLRGKKDLGAITFACSRRKRNDTTSYPVAVGGNVYLLLVEQVFGQVRPPGEVFESRFQTPRS